MKNECRQRIRKNLDSVADLVFAVVCFIKLLPMILPFTLTFIEPTYSFTVACIIATIAAIQEGYYVLYGKYKTKI